MRLFSIVLGLCACVTLLPAQAQRRAPGFSLPSSWNKQIDLADYRGKIVLIDIMKTECAHCGVFAGVLEKVKARYGDKVAVLAIAPAPDNPTTVAKFVADHKVTFPILYDCGQAVFSYVLPDPLHPSVSLPHLYIVNPEGYIAREWVIGPVTEEIFRGEGLFPILDQMLGAKASK
jgi:peroxiredoxin